jgi:hypothetical protein
MRYTRDPDLEALADALQDRGHTFVSIAELCTETLTKHGMKDPQVNNQMVGRWLKLCVVGRDKPVSVKSRLVVRTAKAILAQPILECAVAVGDDDRAS